jgi:hypothetical protein
MMLPGGDRNQYPERSPPPDGRFVITSGQSSHETLGIIPKDVIAKAGARFNHEYYFVGTLSDVITVQTVGGATKPVCLVDVVTMVDGMGYYDFVKYMAGHPEELPQQQYVAIKVHK